MQELANFIGEVGGDTWNTQAAAVVLAGIGASAAAALTAWVAISQGRKTRAHATEINVKEREVKSRELWWDRFQWAAERVLGEDERQRIAGARIMRQLGTMTWMDKGDRILATVILGQAREGADITSKTEATKP